MTTSFEDKTVKELLALLATAAPLVTAELRDRLKELEREIYSEGFSDGLQEVVARETPDTRDAFNRGEAKGLKWAYYAASGAQVAPNTNPLVGPTLIGKLMSLGKKNKQ